jgi:hypothetical protein
MGLWNQGAVHCKGLGATGTEERSGSKGAKDADGCDNDGKEFSA